MQNIITRLSNINLAIAKYPQLSHINKELVTVLRDLGNHSKTVATVRETVPVTKPTEDEQNLQIAKFIISEIVNEGSEITELKLASFLSAKFITSTFYNATGEPLPYSQVIIITSQITDSFLKNDKIVNNGVVKRMLTEAVWKAIHNFTVTKTDNKSVVQVKTTIGSTEIDLYLVADTLTQYFLNKNVTKDETDKPNRNNVKTVKVVVDNKSPVTASNVIDFVVSHTVKSFENRLSSINTWVVFSSFINLITYEAATSTERNTVKKEYWVLNNNEYHMAEYTAKVFEQVTSDEFVSRNPQAATLKSTLAAIIDRIEGGFVVGEVSSNDDYVTISFHQGFFAVSLAIKHDAFNDIIINYKD